MSKSKALQKEVKTHPYALFIGSYSSENTRETYEVQLLGFVRDAVNTFPEDYSRIIPEGQNALYEFPWGSLSANRTEAILQHNDQISESTYNLRLSAVKGVMRKVLQDTDLIAKNYQFADYMRMNGVLEMKGRKTPKRGGVGRFLSSSEILAIAETCAQDISPAGSRDQAIIALGFFQGPRVSEVSNLNFEDYNPETGELTIHDGKGNKSRKIRVWNGAKEALDFWIMERGEKDGPLFLRINKAGTIFHERLGTNALQSILKRRAEQAGVRTFAFHDLRRTALTILTREKGIRIAQQIAGHESIEATAKYDLAAQDEALSASEELFFPFTRRNKNER